MDARTMQKEFERRIMLMDPTLRDTEKLTSDTIFAFLNAAQNRLVTQTYLQYDQSTDGSRVDYKLIDSLKPLICDSTLTEDTYVNKYINDFNLPDDYMYYIQSNSVITKSHLANTLTDESVVANKDIKYTSVNDILPAYYDKKIIRVPYAVINKNNSTTLQIIHDEYTLVTKVELTYYRKPNQISLDQDCELPDTVHMDLVEQAVEIFVTEAKYRLNMKQNDKN